MDVWEKGKWRWDRNWGGGGGYKLRNVKIGNGGS